MQKRGIRGKMIKSLAGVKIGCPERDARAFLSTVLKTAGQQDARPYVVLRWAEKELLAVCIIY